MNTINNTIKLYHAFLRAMALVFLLFINYNALGQSNFKIPSVPNPAKLANDFTNTLSASELKFLEQKLKTFYDTTTNQITMVMVNSLDGIPISDYAYKVFKTWGIGTQKNDNGVLLLIALADHKVRIEVGQGLEGALPDLVAKEIINVDIGPNFKQQQYFNGINEALDDICKATQHEFKGTPANLQQEGFPIELLFLMLLLLIVFIFIMSKRKNNGYYVSRRGYQDWGNDGWNNRGGGFIGGFTGGGLFDGGGSSGGDFGGFGGGGSSGGGASGDW
jgi:uncharacterized protein